MSEALCADLYKRLRHVRGQIEHLRNLEAGAWDSLRVEKFQEERRGYELDCIRLESLLAELEQAA